MIPSTTWFAISGTLGPVGLLLMWLGARSRRRARVRAAPKSFSQGPPQDVSPPPSDGRALHFVYDGPFSPETDRRVVDWQESDTFDPSEAPRCFRYVTGFDLLRKDVRTFRLDRAREWLDGSERLLARPPPRCPPSRGAKADAIPQIHFSGFRDQEGQDLVSLAEGLGMDVLASATHHLDYLCLGARSARSTMARAKAAGVQCLTGSEFLAMVYDGVLPDEPPE